MAPKIPDHVIKDPSGSKRKLKSEGKQLKKAGIVLVIQPRWLYCYLPLISVMIAISSALCIGYREQIYMTDKIQSLGIEALDIFANFDTDGDFYLSLEEAEPLLLQFVDQSKNKDTTFNLDVKPNENGVTVHAHFIPLNISTMTKDFEHDLHGNQSFTGLFNWINVNNPSKEFAVSSFHKFLPDLGTNPKPGVVYDIVKGPKGIFGTTNLPSDRFYPPRVSGTDFFIYRLLSMFHPRPFVTMRFPPQGVMGCVRALSQDFIEVVLRFHIEFQLNEPPQLPFWFTPGQLTGSLIMARDGSTVKHFYLHVPNGRSLNVDMEWLTDEKDSANMEVDIGYLPLMELTTQKPLGAADVFEEHDIKEDERIQWDIEITTAEASKHLEESFFPFKKIKYYNFSDAFHVAEKESKLVHSIVLWGALDDQSC